MSRLIDITNNKYGKLTVIKRVENDKNNRAQWLCQCECGNTVIYTGTTLRKGKAKSCGCLIKEDLTNKIFERLTVIDFAFSKNGQRYWNCECECGNKIIVTTNSV